MIDLFKKLHEIDSIENREQRIEEYKTQEKSFARKYKLAMTGAALGAGLMFGSLGQSFGERVYTILQERKDPGVSAITYNTSLTGMWIYTLSVLPAVWFAAMRNKFGKRLEEEFVEESIPEEVQGILKYHHQRATLKNIFGETF